MADSFYTAADLLKINDENAVDHGCTDLLQNAPLLGALAAEYASNGTKHTYLKETGAPSVGFRAVNAGREFGKSGDTAVTIDLQIMSGNSAIDKALADQDKKGAAHVCGREANRHLKNMFKGLEKQIIYGTSADSGGFIGFAQALAALSNPMVLGGGGSTNLSSVWFLRTDEDGNDVQFILGNEGNLELGETFVQMLPDADGKYLPKYVTPCEGWGAVQVGSQYSLGRIANLDAGSNTLNSAKLIAALQMFPEDRQPNKIVMNKRSLAQYWASLQAVSTTGAAVPRPTEFQGIPFVVTGSILTSETAVS